MRTGGEEPQAEARLPLRGLTRRWLGVPWLFAVSYSAIGFSIYFSIGLVAERGLALTPLIFLGVGVVFMLNAMTYVEGAAMFRERGGSSTLARHAFNELVSFVAGWAILIDYLIVIALAAISVPHYLTPLSASFGEGAAELITAGAVIAAVAAINIVGFSGAARQLLLTAIAIGGVLLLVAVIVVGTLTSFDAAALTAELDLFTSPSLEDVLYAGVIATVAYAGIEAASDLVPDLEFEAIDLRRLVAAGVVIVPILYTGVAAISVMALPVVATPDGPMTPLATSYLEEPILGVVESYDPAWVAEAMRVAVVAVAPLVLGWAASTSMLGLSRHTYTLATNRQIPSWLGKLNKRWTTPHVAILIAAVISFALVIPGDVLFLGGLYAFGATIAFAIAHISLVRLRFTDPGRERPYRVPLNVRWRGVAVPLPALAAGALTILAWVSVLLFHDEARYIGGAWMLFGLGAYVVYRVGVEGTSLTKRVSVPASALVKDVPALEYGGILVPVFGTPLDDDIVSTAGQPRGRRGRPGQGAAAPGGRLRGGGAAHGAARRAARKGADGGRQPGARQGRAGGVGVRDGRGCHVGGSRARRRLRNRPGGARAGRRADRHGRGAPDAHSRRCGAGGGGRIAARRDRAGYGLRAAKGARAGAADGSAVRRG